MPDQNLRIVTFGELAAGFDQEGVEVALARLCKYGPDKLSKVFAGDKFVFKDNLNNQSAKRYLNVLTQTGIVCQIERPQPAKPTTRERADQASTPAPSAPVTQVSCPKCGTEQDEAVSCILCQVVMGKFGQSSQAQMHTHYNVPAPPAQKQKRGLPLVAILLSLLLVGGAGAFFYLGSPATSLKKLQTGLKSIGKDDSALRKKLGDKKASLASVEKVISDITNQFESIEANASICPTTGNKAITTMVIDPRADLRKKGDALREEIRLLEEELGE